MNMAYQSVLYTSANESDLMFSLKQQLWNFADSLEKIMFSLFLRHLPSLTACIIYTQVF